MLLKQQLLRQHLATELHQQGARAGAALGVGLSLLAAGALVMGAVRVLPHGAEEPAHAPRALRAWVCVPALLLGAWVFIQGVL